MTTEEQQLLTLSSLLQLEKSFRNAATLAELSYLLVNDCRGLLEFRHAALWQCDSEKVIAISNIAVIDNNVPYIIFLKRLCKYFGLQTSVEINAVNIAELPDNVAIDWNEWLPESALWIPLTAYGQPAKAGLLLVREPAWNEGETYLLEHIADSFGHAWLALNPKKSSWVKRFLNHKTLLLTLIVLTAVLFIPVRMSALAPATVIPTKPTILTAPIEGVIDAFYIQPNDNVEKEALLVKLDDKTLKNKLSVTRKTLAIAVAEHRKTAQQAMFDNESKAQVNILKSRIDLQQAEVKSMEDWLKRVEIKAPHSGVAIFSDVNDWIGKPIATGEKILMLANPKQVELEIQLPISDAIKLKPESEILLFLNIEPLTAIKAQLYFISYQAQVNAEDQLAYRLKAHFETNENLPRIGLKGTAKVYGENVSLAYYLFRKPLATARQWLGL
ncbi:MAG: HlyD family efflux transporter periplasmic adaptor subunit [Methylococcaceae bacterium]|nr:HlyD family efflux transporter periplasmic adaptor subunit [Methylococcaceae bacterium]